MITVSGIGYDIHRFAQEARPLVLGGVVIPYEHGLDGHSDADVLCHAIADAILGAASLPDIGFWFPPGDPACKNISSLEIVAKAVEEVHNLGGKVIHVDSCLLAEAPKIAPHLSAMKEQLSAALSIPASRVGIKATTNEKMGCIGRKEGIAAFATSTVLLPLDLD
jgi:2-C-methyl-D-erythritol 2,4-cyclodiphosphate synthase